MVKRSKEIQSSYHIRFNPTNERHHAAAAYMKSVKDKYKTAFVAAAIEAYREAHPHGIDYQELEAIQKKSWSPFQPKAPIQENLKNRREPSSKGIVSLPDAPKDGANEDAQTNKAIDKAMNHYGIE